MDREEQDRFWQRVDAELVEQEAANERVREFLGTLATLEEREQFEWQQLHHED